MNVFANVTAVAIAGRALVIEGPPGSGKSSLALALIDRGACLIGDDAVTLQPGPGSVMLAPPPNTAGMIEIAGVGHAKLATAAAPAALVLTLEARPARFPETLDSRMIGGQAIPCLPFDPDAPSAALRAEYALEIHGLRFP